MKLRLEQGTEETPDGKVVGVFMKQEPGNGQKLLLTGTVEGERLHVLIDNGRLERTVRWTDQAVGLYKSLHLFEQKKLQPDDTFTFPRYEPIVNCVVNMRVHIKDQEEVDASRQKADAVRVELTPDKLEAAGQSIQLPGEVWWLDSDFVPQRRQFGLDGLGTVTLTRGTRAARRRRTLPPNCRTSASSR